MVPTPGPPAQTPEVRSPFLCTFLARGYHHQGTDLAALDAAMAAGPITAYWGCDLTAESLHLGNLVGLMTLRMLQRFGHKPIVLLGGGTTKVGDPSGKDATRPLLSPAAIAANKARLARVFARYLTFGDGPAEAVFVDNDDWLSALAYIPFLRDVGPHFTINRMLTMDSVAKRLEREQPLTFLEFNYMILQGYDFVELHRRMGCTLQVGGADQWGNILSGVELGRRMDGVHLHALTWPLLQTAAGEKMGKSAGNAVWLSPELFAPYAFWQALRNVDDADVGRLLRLFTDLPLDEIQRLEALEGAARNDAKKVLATETTRILHGDDAAEAAEETARRTFEEGDAALDLPTIEVARGDLAAGVAAFELFQRAGLVASGSEGRRLVAQGGARLNGAVLSDPLRPVTLDDVGEGGVIRLQAGRKRHALVRPA